MIVNSCIYFQISIQSGNYILIVQDLTDKTKEG